MKAILVNDDRSLRWDNVPNPILGNDDCLVKIEAAALNRADLMQREGDYPPPPGCPEWMGLEIAGTIIEIADGAREKSNWKIGDKVCALLGGGGYAEYANIKYDMLMPVPENHHGFNRRNCKQHKAFKRRPCCGYNQRGYCRGFKGRT